MTSFSNPTPSIPAVQWILLAAVLAGFGVIEIRILRDRGRLAPVREAVKKEAVVYRTPISAQWGRGCPAIPR